MRKSFDKVEFYDKVRETVRKEADRAAFDIASVGDEFYLVVLHNKKKELVFAFHTMMYECNEIA